MNSEFLFPHRSIAGLKGLHGQDWDATIQRIATLPEMDLDSLAFSLMMVQLCQCTNCSMGSYKASLGCTACAQRAVAASGNGDSRWMEHLEAARAEITAYLAHQKEGEERS
jgi:hypothetical protein